MKQRRLSEAKCEFLSFDSKNWEPASVPHPRVGNRKGRLLEPRILVQWATTKFPAACSAKGELEDELKIL
jgi:hypothetical protein